MPAFALYFRSVDELFQGMGENLPDIIAYNAGTDVLRGDPLGLLDITGQVSLVGPISSICITFLWLVCVESYQYCIHRNFSDLTIIAIIVTGRKDAIKIFNIFSIAFHVIYKPERKHYERYYSKYC